jgi:murein DD-endopeptidase MepM/ murein hydrolase activator NlpD
VALVLSACTHDPAPCPREAPAALEQVAAVNVAHDSPFRFPLDASSLDDGTFHAWFCDRRDRQGKESLHHAAEDYDRPAGTPVYAVADGRVSYSGRAGGYGWLVIVDHPQFNLYSLYGHLSPSRWSREPGPVSKGTLLGYLGDPWENGGSRRSPLEPHLHFGLRAGQRLDYPKTGEWRWMAGWIVLCPRDIGWLQPSLVITSGAVPLGGFLAPTPPLLTSLGVALTLTYSALGVGMLLVMMRRRMRFQLLLPGLLLVTAGIVLVGNGMLQTHTLLALGIVLTGIGLFRLVDPLGPRRRSAPGERPGPT